MSVEAVLKIGGSLSHGEGLPALCSAISVLGRSHSLLVIPGGGDFADQVRKADRRFQLDPTAAHFMAILAMDQYGYLLNQLIADSCLTADLNYACKSAESGRTAILLPSALVIKEDPLPHSWQVTSDTIAAWIADKLLSRLILLKDVDGLFNSDGLIPNLTPSRLADHAGGVDEYLSNILSSARLDAWIINGFKPERLTELLNTGRTAGTQISP